MIATVKCERKGRWTEGAALCCFPSPGGRLSLRKGLLPSTIPALKTVEDQPQKLQSASSSLDWGKLTFLAFLSHTAACNQRERTAMTTYTVVRARVESGIQVQAADALQAMGLSVSDAIRLLLLRVADEKRLPFVVHEPNQATVEAMKELECGGGKEFSGLNELRKDLGI